MYDVILFSQNNKMTENKKFIAKIKWLYYNITPQDVNKNNAK